MNDNERAVVVQLQRRIGEQPEGLEQGEVEKLLAEQGVERSRYGIVTRTAGIRLNNSVAVYEQSTSSKGWSSSQAQAVKKHPAPKESLPSQGNVLSFEDADITFTSGVVSINGKVQSVVITLYPS